MVVPSHHEEDRWVLLPFPFFSQSPTRGLLTLLHTMSVPRRRVPREQPKEATPPDPDPPILGVRCGWALVLKRVGGLWAGWSCQPRPFANPGKPWFARR